MAEHDALGTSSKKDGLQRKLSLFSSTNLVIANMIGAGIFTTSGLLMGELGSPLVMIGLWGSVGGSSMIIFLAGLQDVPVELIEAAEIDGAGTWRKFWSITLPMLSPVIFFNMIMGIIWALRVFDVAFIATAGGPANASRFISLHIYEMAFVRYEMGYAAALAWILVTIIVTLTILQFRLSGRWVFYQGEVRT